METEKLLTPANLFLRLWAGLIDIWLCSLVFPFFVRLSEKLVSNIVAYFAQEALLGEGISHELVSACLAAFGIALSVVAIGWLVSSSVAIAAILWRFGTTPGKAVLGLAVSRRDGRRIGFFRAWRRESVKILSLIPLGLGFLPAIFSPERRTFHDWVSHSFVRTKHRPRKIGVSLALGLSLLGTITTYPILRSSIERYSAQIQTARRSYQALRVTAPLAWRIIEEGLREFDN